MTYFKTILLLTLFLLLPSIQPVYASNMRDTASELLYTQELGGPYTSTWSANPSNHTNEGETAYLTLLREGKEGYYLVNLVIDCKSGDYYLGAGIQEGSFVNTPEDAKNTVPFEAIDNAKAIFCIVDD